MSTATATPPKATPTPKTPVAPPTAEPPVNAPFVPGGKKAQPKEDKRPFVVQRYGAPMEKPIEPAAAAKKRDEPPAADPNAAPKVVPPVKKKVAPPAAPLIDAVAMGKAIGDAVAPHLKPTAPAKTEVKTQELAFTERHDKAVLEKIEKMRPELKGRAEKFVASLEATSEYEGKWIAAHPGQDFDPESAEHKEFLAQHSLDDIDPELWAEAEEELRTDKATDRAAERLKKDIEPVAQTQKLHGEMKNIRTNQAAVGRMVFAKLGDDFGKVLDADGAIDRAEIARLVAENPIRNLAFTAVERAETFTEQAYRLIRKLPELPVPDAPHLKATHVTANDVWDFISAQEQLFANLPNVPLAEGGKLQADGRTFVSAASFVKMTAEEQKKHWRFDETMIQKMYAAEQAAEATAAIEQKEQELKTYATARGWKPAEGGTPATATPPPKSPPGTVAPIVAQPGAGGGGENPSANGTFTARRYG